MVQLHGLALAYLTKTRQRLEIVFRIHSYDTYHSLLDKVLFSDFPSYVGLLVCYLACKCTSFLIYEHIWNIALYSK